MTGFVERHLGAAVIISLATAISSVVSMRVTSRLYVERCLAYGSVDIALAIAFWVGALGCVALIVAVAVWLVGRVGEARFWWPFLGTTAAAVLTLVLWIPATAWAGSGADSYDRGPRCDEAASMFSGGVGRPAPYLT